MSTPDAVRDANGNPMTMTATGRSMSIPIPELPPATCANCAHSFADGPGGALVCRRYPPTFHLRPVPAAGVQRPGAPPPGALVAAVGFPSVHGLMFCGEFERYRRAL